MLTDETCKVNLQRSSIALRLFLLSALVIWFGVLPGCTTLEGGGQLGPQQRKNALYHKVEEGGWITVFLNLKEASGPEVSMQVTAVEVRTGNSWKTLNSTPMVIDSAKVGAGQIFIARNGVKPGYYESLRFVIQQADIRSGSGQTPLALAASSVEMELPSGLNLSKGDSHSLFITWDVEKTVSDPQGLDAGLHANLQAIPLLSNLLFVACPELDTVYVVRTDKNWVISSIGVTGRPAYIDIDLRRGRLYVLATDDYSIKVIDLTAYKLIDRYHMQMDYAPGFMTVDPDKNFAFVLDEKGRGIVKVDLANGAIVQQATLNFQPRYSTYLEEQRKLAISTAETNFVYLLNPDNLFTAGSLSVGNRPEGLLEFRGNLFVAESGSDSVASYEIDGRVQRATVNVGFSPMRLFLKSNQLYATSSADGTVTVMFPGQLSVSREIFVGGRPGEISGSENNRWLYVGNEVLQGLTVIDATSNRISGFVDLGTSSLGMAVID